MHRQKYNDGCRDAKTQITRDIVKIVKSECGRFLKLKLDKNGKHWIPVCDDIARSKSHAMRDSQKPGNQ